MKIWLDLSNSPHPLLFAPIARRLGERGHEVGVTARDNAQTAELTLARWPDARIIGAESPQGRRAKARMVGARVRALRRWARDFRADVALSHNSYAQILAARSLAIPVVTAMDYEGQPLNHVAFRLAKVILMPEALRDSAVRAQGASARRTSFYSGFKEEIYLGDFEPDPGVCDSLLGALEDRRLVVMRTPPTRAVYHRFGNELFTEAIDALCADDRTLVVVLPRYPEQRRELETLGLANLRVPAHAVDSRSLMYRADLVVGAGGTMTREAALMGVPTYSVFAGRQPAVDRALEREGLLKRLERAADLLPLLSRPAPPRPLGELRARASELVELFVRAIGRCGCPRAGGGAPSVGRSGGRLRAAGR